MHSPVTFRHAQCLNFLDRLLAGHVEKRGLGQVFREVVAVRLGTRHVFLPDLAFFTTGQCQQLQPTFAPFAPTFVVEALSAATADRDTGPKFAAYEEHGVKEYWILDPETAAHRFYRREGEFLIEFGAVETVVSARSIPGFWVREEWLNPETAPPVLEALAEVLDGVG